MSGVILALLVNFCHSITVVVDLGSFYTKSSTFNSTLSPQITENLESKRLTPSFVSFRSKKGINMNKSGYLHPEEVESVQPSIGERALSLMELRPFMGSGYFSYFCDIQEEEKEKFSKIVFANSSISRFSYDDTLALFMNLYISSVVHSPETKKIGLVVPATMTIRQRRILENAVKNAKHKSIGTVDDNEAVFTYYAVERIRLFNDNPQTVLFVDVGATSIKAYAGRFELVMKANNLTANINVTKLSYVISNKEGGAFITSRMVNHFIKKHDMNNISEAERRRLFTACEKIKSTLLLSSIKSTQQCVDNINGHTELCLVMRKEEMEPYLKPFFNNISEVVGKAIGNLSVDDIQLIGGCSRVFGITNLLQNEFNISVKVNLNSDETVSIGGGYAFQYKVGSSRLSKIQWNDTYSPLTISISADGEEEPVCVRGQKCKSSVTLNNVGSLINISYDQKDLPLKVMNSVLSYSLPKNENPLLLQFTHSPTQIYIASRCNGTDCTTTQVLPAFYDFSSSTAFSAILRMEAKRAATAQSRGQLEQLTQHILENLEHNETFKYFMSDTQRFTIHRAAERMKKWLWDHADTIQNETQFKIYFNELNSYVIPVYQRMHENKTLSYAESLLHTTMQYAVMASMRDWAVNKTWLNKTTLDEFQQVLQEAMKFLDELSAAKKSTPPWEKLNITAGNVSDISRKIYNEMMRIEAIPPPYSKISFWDRFKRLFGFGKSSNISNPANNKHRTTPPIKSDSFKHSSGNNAKSTPKNNNNNPGPSSTPNVETNKSDL